MDGIQRQGIYLLISLCFNMASFVDCQADSSHPHNGDFMGSASVLTTLDFHGSDLHIYAHSGNTEYYQLDQKNRFYVMPVVEIDALSLEVHHSFLVDAYRMDFTVILWTEDLQVAALEALDKLYRPHGEQQMAPVITLNQVQMIPMEEVRLVWNSEVPLPAGIWLSRDWIPFSRNPHQLRFSFMCEKQDVCEKLKTEMGEHPSEFRKLNLEFTTSGKSSTSRPVEIKGSDLTSSEIFRDLQKEENFPGGEENVRYLTAEDLSILSLEVAENVLSTMSSESEFFPNKETASVADLLFEKLSSTQVSAVFMSETAWNSLRWELSFTRPDTVLNTLNRILRIMHHFNGNQSVAVINESAFHELEKNYVYAAELKRMENPDKCDSVKIEYGNRRKGVGFLARKSSGGRCGSLFGSRGSGMDFGQSGSNGQKMSVKEAGLEAWLLKLPEITAYFETHSEFIEFNGEKFVHKPSSLYQLHLSEVTDNLELLRTDVEVQKLQKIYHIKVAISSEMTSPYRNEIDQIHDRVGFLTQNLTRDLTEIKEQWFQERALAHNQLKDEIKELKTKQEQEFADIRGELQQQISNIRQEYKRDITSSDEEIKEELSSLRVKDVELENSTRAVVMETDSLRLLQETMQNNMNRTLGNLTDTHNTFRNSVIGEINRLTDGANKSVSGDVAFLATTALTRNVAFGGNVLLDKVLLNPGGGYNPLTGRFRAPLDGLYLFYFSLYLKGNGIEVRVYVENGVAFKTRDGTSNTYQYPCGTFLVRLNKDQRVHIKFSYNTKVYGDINTWFGGHLVKAL